MCVEIQTFEGMVDKSRQFRTSMESAPWKQFQYKNSTITIDVDGKITTEQGIFEPFPCQITNAVVCGDSLIATWVDHELRLARMAKISLDDEMKNGISKAQLRLNRNTAMVEGATWCHILDAEPLALTSQDDKIFFALWSKGMYCIDSDSNEIWRLPLFDSMAKSPPRSEEVAAISTIGDEKIVVWSKGGKFREIDSNSGTILNESKIDIECDLEEVFNHDEIFLLSSKDGWAWEVKDSQVIVARKLRGTIQDAVFDNGDWRVISWREDILMRSESVERSELGVQLVKFNDVWHVLDNQGQTSPHMG